MPSAQHHVPLHLCLLLTLGGCDLIIDASEVSEQNPTDHAYEDTGDDSDLEEHLLTPDECERICAEREDIAHENGFCPFEEPSSSGDCRDVCADHAVFQPSTQEAFASCVATDHLCYTNIHDCVAGTAYPGTALAHLMLTATGFAAHAGKPVVLGLQDQMGAFSMLTAEVKEDGAFVNTWMEEVHAGESRQLVLYYIDQNENGVCDPAVDVTGSVSLERSADIDELSYAALVGPPASASDGSWICSYI